MERRGPTSNPFQALGLPVTATNDQIKQSYRKLAMEYHPDKNRGDAKAEEKFKEVSIAYEAIIKMQRHASRLKFDRRKKRYNAMYFKRVGTGLGKKLSGLFWPKSSGAGLVPATGEDVEIEAPISFEESITGSIYKTRLQVYVTCGKCDGHGAARGSAFATCPKCQGSGHHLEGSGGLLKPEFCKVCNGGGRVIREKCRPCKGSGRVKGDKRISVRIPEGAAHGNRFLLKGKGHAGVMKWPNGDVILTVHVSESQVFKRKGDDLYTKVRVPFTTAVLGGHAIAPTTSGRVKVTVPQGVKTNTLLRLNGRGVAGRGDQYVRLVIEIPDRLTQREKMLLKKFARMHGYPLGFNKKKGLWSSLKRSVGLD